MHVNEPGRTEWEGFATATRAAAAGGVTTIIDMPLNSLPPTVDAPALRIKRSRRRREGLRRRRFLGRRDPRQLGSLRSAARAGVFGFKCFLLDSGVPEFPPLTPADLHDYLTAIRDVRRADDRARRGRRIDRACPRRPRPRYADFLASRPRGAENTAIAAGHRGGPLDRRPGAHPAPVQLRRAADDRAPPSGTGSASPSRPARTTWSSTRRRSPPAPPSSSAARRSGSRRTGTCCGRAWPTAPSTASCPTTHRAPRSSSGWTPATSGWPGAASPRCRSACPPSGPQARARGFTLADVTRWMSAAPAGAGRAGPQGRIDRRPGRRPVGVRAGPDNSSSTRRSCTTAIPSPPYAGRTLTGVVRSTWLRGTDISADVETNGDRRGRLLRRGEA